VARRPAATFYFAPVEPEAGVAPADLASRMSSLASRYLIDARLQDGSWPADGGRASEDVTAAAAVALARVPEVRDRLASTAAWLRRALDKSQFQTRDAWADAVIASRLLGDAARPDAVAPPLDPRDAASTIANVLLASAASRPAPSVDAALDAMVGQELRWGGFGSEDDLEGTARVVEAIATLAIDRPTAAARRALAALERAREWSWRRPLARVPGRLAAWLACRTLCGAGPATREARRVCRSLHALQHADGSWGTGADRVVVTARVARSLATYGDAVDRRHVHVARNTPTFSGA
jgi:hypothetical protein